jgi:hypothetical protein
VIVYELIGLAFLFKYLFGTERKMISLVLAGVFTFFLFTKQDGGGLAFLLCLAILLYEGSLTKNGWRSPFFVEASW